MKTLVNRFLCNFFLFFLPVLILTNAYGDDSFLDFENLENDPWLIEENAEYDPLEIINRPLYHFNDFVYFQIMDPVTNAYIRVTPKAVRRSISHFYSNLKYPIRFLGNALQLKGKEAYHETLKFLINSSIGMAGLFKYSDNFDTLKNIPNEDISQALAFWGVPEGPYLVIPLLGPSTLRDFPIMLFERELNPLDVHSYDWDSKNSELETAFSVVEILQFSEAMLPRYKDMKKASIDSYSLVKSAYLQQKEIELAK